MHWLSGAWAFGAWTSAGHRALHPPPFPSLSAGLSSPHPLPSSPSSLLPHRIPSPPPLTVLRKLIEFGAQSLLNPRAAARAWISSAEAPSAPAVRSTWKAANLPVLGFRPRSSSCRGRGGWRGGGVGLQTALLPLQEGGGSGCASPNRGPPSLQRSPPPSHRARTPLPLPPLPLAPGTKPPPPPSSPVAHPPPLPAGATPPFPSPRG